MSNYPFGEHLSAPEPLAQPETVLTVLNAYRKRRKVTIAQMAVALGVSTASAGRYVLPPESPNHKRPNRAAAEQLRTWSGGHVNIANYADAWTPEIDAEWLAAKAFEPAGAGGAE